MPADGSVSSLLRQAMAHHEAGQLAEAKAGYRAVLARDPACVEALHYFGQLAFQVAQYPAAAELMGRAAALAPDDPVLLGNLGETLRQLHRLDEALVRFRRSLALKPGDPIVCNNLGNALTTLGRYDEAVACYRQALAARPGYANAHNNLGNLHRQRRAFAEAEACFRRALELDPRFVEALNNLGTVLFVLGRLDEATDAFERALALRPDADLWNNLGGVLARCGRADDALAAFRRAVALAPQRADLHSNLVFALNYHPAETPESLRTEQRRWHERHGRPLAAAAAVPHANDRSPERRLRVGYVSPDFRDHVVGRNLLPLFRHHAHDAFEIVCYAHVPQPDAMTAEFRRLADGWRDIAPLNDDQLAAAIRADGIDVLVDLALHTAKNRLLAFARRPAPVQVSFAGYPGGTGLETIDAHLTDPFLEPPGPAPETGPDAPFRLPHSFWCCDPAGPAPEVGPLPAATHGHVTFGCLNNLAKINPAVIRLWCDVLRVLPDARFALLSPAGRHRRDLLAAFAADGVTADRIQFTEHRPHAGYLEAYRGIDIALDTFPYNGHTTSLDAFRMGVPVVTLVGTTPVARAGWSQLSNLGLPELAAATPADFVRIAVALAGDLPRLAALRAGLRARLERSPLADAAGFARGIEVAYRTLWRRWAARSAGV